MYLYAGQWQQYSTSLQFLSSSDMTICSMIGAIPLNYHSLPGPLLHVQSQSICIVCL